MSQLNSFVISTPNLSTLVAPIKDSILLQYGKNCNIYYPPIQSGCLNCFPSPVGDKSANMYLNGGPMPFQDGQNCPLCFGQYWQAVEQTDSAIMTISWLPQGYDPNFPAGNNYANARILTRGFASDLQKIVNATYIEFDQEGGFSHYRFKLDGQPTFTDNFTDCRYFYAYWKQV